MASSSPDWSVESKERFSALLRDEVWPKLSPNGDRLSQNKVGALFGVAGSTIDAWLGGSIPEINRLQKIAAVLDWSLDEIHSYLRHGTRPTRSPVSKILKEIRYLPPEDIAYIGQQVITFLAADRKSNSYHYQ